MSYTILHIAVSPMGERSFSRKSGEKILKSLLAKHAGATVITRDLAAHPLPHVDGAMLGAFFTPPEKRDAAAAALAAPSDKAIDEIFAADALIIEAPMWNFGLPSVLKAWVDHVARAGRTFKYTATGAVALTPAGKKAYIASSRGGIYSEGEALAVDHQETYLKAFLAFIGITDVAVIRTEGVALGADAAVKAVAQADEQVARFVV